jgi:endonuclease/exonuclease/phosphatase family metal-dependent hydrolase
MKIFLVLLTLWGVAGSAWAAPLRVVSFNVENSLGGTTNTAKLTRVAERLERIGADVVTLQELFTSDTGPCSQLANRLGLPYQVNTFSLLKIHNQAILSRYPISQAVNVFGINTGMVRPILLAKIDVPNLTNDPWVAVVHLKSGTSVSDQFNRSVELVRLKNALRERGVTSQSPVILVGDFNMRSTVANTTFFQDPDGINGYGNITDPIYPLTGSQNTDDHFPATEMDGTPGLNILKLDLRQAGTGGSTSTHPQGALDHIMVSEPIRSRQPSSEIYHVTNDANGVGGLAKFGGPPATAYTYTSDHYPVFADLVFWDVGDGFPDDVVAPALGWNVSSNTLTFVNRPVASATTDVTATDDQDPMPVVSCYPLNPTYTAAGTNKITYMARDRIGNIRTVDRTVTVAAWGQGGITHNLHWPPRMNLPPQGSGNVYSRLQIPGFTEGVAVAANVQAWIGFHGQNTDPSTWPESAWKVASLNPAALGAADEYWAQASSSELGIGTHYFASRWSIDSGAYGYGGISGYAVGVGGVLVMTNGNGILTVRASSIDWANLQWPPAGQIPLGGSFTIYARVYRAGVTPNAGAPGGNFRAQIGVSTVNENPEGSTAFEWTDADYGAQYGNDDEFQRTVTGLAAGAYRYASRFSDDGGATWTYGGIAADGSGTGVWDGVTYASGILTVGSTVGTWSSNMPVTSELVGKYAIGGAANLSAASESPVMEAQSNSLSLTAIVRKDDPRLAVWAEWATDLGAGWSGEGVSSATNGLAQPADPGLERRKFTVPYDPANEPRKFLRLKATLAQ